MNRLKEQTIITLNNRINQRFQNNDLPKFTNEIIIEETKSNSQGSTELLKSMTEWFDISNGFNAKYIRITSSDIFHYKLTSEDGFIFIASSTVFSYHNPKKAIKIEIANGSMDIDFQTSIISTGPFTKDIKINYIIVNY